VLIANEQTAGRGRMGRTYQSKEGLGVYLSILFRPTQPLQQLMALPALGAVAACRAIERVSGLPMEIKWPNDLVAQGKKLGGILCESVSDPACGVAVIMGIGINVCHRAENFDGAVAEFAASLEMLTGKTVSCSALAAALVEELDILRREALESPQLWLEEYRRLCMTVGKEVQLITGEERRLAAALAIDGDYGLVVREADGTVQTVRSGEVSVRGLYGYAP
jgi:BirA family biotin operon repressor/biotin-[acetyl-CoA-carboxylase] ligase